MERPLGELRLCAVLIDGTPFEDRQMIVALRIGCDGRETVLGVREGATENTTVVSSLPRVSWWSAAWTSPRRVSKCVDGGEAVHTAIRRRAGEAAFIQRCQIHKKRNVVDRLRRTQSRCQKETPEHLYAITGSTPMPSGRWIVRIAN